MSDTYLTIDNDGNPIIRLFSPSIAASEYELDDEMLQHLIGNILKHGVEYERCQEMNGCDCHMTIRAKKYTTYKRKYWVTPDNHCRNISTD